MDERLIKLVADLAMSYYATGEDYTFFIPSDLINEVKNNVGIVLTEEEEAACKERLNFVSSLYFRVRR